MNGLCEMDTNFSQAVSRNELLAKAEQLQKPSSLVARARTGLCYLLLGKAPDTARDLLTDGIRFLEILEKDLECDELLREPSRLGPRVFLLGNRERFYQPSEVLPTDVTDMRTRIVNVRGILERLTNPSTSGEVNNEEKKKALDELVEFGQKYTERTSEALAEYKFGPMLRWTAGSSSP